MYLLIFFHFLSDWICQIREMALRKSSSNKWLLRHGLVMFVAFYVFGFAIGLSFAYSFLLALIYMLFHMIQDRFIWKLWGHFRLPKDKDELKEYITKSQFVRDYWWFFTIAIDQVLHLWILMFLYGRFI